MDQIAQVKQALDIVTVIGSYVQLKKSGRNYKGICPFHSENSPSFMVSPELQIFRCFGCGESGDVISFVQKLEGLDFPTALEKLADQAGIKLEKVHYDAEASLRKQIFWINDQAARFYNYILLNHPAGKPGLDYLVNKRKLSTKTINSFLLGYAPDASDTLLKFFKKKGQTEEFLLKAGLIAHKDNGEVSDKFRGRITFPLTGVDGKVVGFTARTLFDRQPKYLNTAETPVFHKSSFVFGLDKAKVAVKKSGVIFVEGQMDVISAVDAGITNVVATSGTSLTQAQLKLISRYTNDLTFCFDSDSAGITAAYRGIEMAENMGFNIKVAVIPSGFKDLDELVKANIDQTRAIFDAAVPAYDFLLFTILKKHNKSSSEGKKKIIDEIVPWFSRLKSPVLRDHYTKEIARELDLNQETVSQALLPGNIQEMSQKPVKALEIDTTASPQSLESYIISLLLHAEAAAPTKDRLDFMTAKTYKVEPSDFSDEKLQKLLISLLKYLNEGSKSGKNTAKNKKQFDPKDFKNSLTDEQTKFFDDLYMQDVDTDNLSYNREFDTALFRLKSNSAKRRMHEITVLLKNAEKSNDIEAVKALTAEFEQLKSLLVDKNINI